MGWSVIIAMVVALIAIDWWRRRSWRKWDEVASKEDNSLAGAMERSKRHASR
jgi:hypothetical protein